MAKPRSRLWLAAIALVLSGCAHVELAGLREVSDIGTLEEYRRAPGTGVDAHAVANPDIIEFSVAKANAPSALCRIVIKVHCDSAKCAYPDGEPLMLDGRHIRTTAYVLNTVEDIDVVTTNNDCGTAGRKTLHVSHIVGSDWLPLKSALEGSWTLAGTRLALNRIPQPERRAFPGDHVRITTEYQGGNGSTGVQAYTFTDADSVVDSSGYLYIPPLFYPAAPPQAPPFTEIGRAFGQQAAAARVRVKVWQLGRGLAAQPTIDKLERCLASRWTDVDVPTTVSDGLKAQQSDCRQLGIDSSAFGDSDAENIFLRYRLEVRQTWTAVLWDGRRVERPFVPGETVAAGAQQVFREAAGRDRWPDYAVYATIDPRPELGETPFYARLDGETVLTRVLIAPGDVIQISNWRPWISAGGP